MGYNSRKSSHCGPKNIGRKTGYYGRRNAAKINSNVLRRQEDKAIIKNEKFNLGSQEYE